MNALTVWNYEQNQVRTVMIDDKPFWVAADVCGVLGVNNVSDVLARLDDDEKDNIDLIDAIGRARKTNVVSESGLYSMILRSDKPSARSFRKWVTSEVLPQLRKTGTYSIEPARQMTAAEIMLGQANILVDHERQLAEIRADLDARKTVENANRAVIAELMPAPVETPCLTMRAALVAVIEAAGYATAQYHAKLWSALYTHFERVYSIDLRTRAKNSKMTTIEYAEQKGYIDRLYSLAREMFGNVVREDAMTIAPPHTTSKNTFAVQQLRRGEYIEALEDDLD